MNHKQTFVLVLIFLVDKWVQHYLVVPNWFSSYADDLLLIPLVMGLALWVQQNVVNHQFAFQKKQIIGTWLFFSLFFEVLAPIIWSTAYTRDVLDIVAYGLGALIFAFFLNHGAEKTKE